jgi:HAD superfamily hydrolase (TIGR01509 family)
MKALIFDFDGLIVDTEMPDYISWQEIYQQHGCELPLDLWASIVGGTAESDFEPHEYLEELVGGQVDREAIWIKRRKSYLENLESQPVLPGVLDYLQTAQRLGLKLAIASSSPESWVVGHLTRLGLSSYFEVVCTADDVERTKPDPSLFLLAAEKVGANSDEIIVFEDSPNGVRAANRARMFVVAVPNPLTAQLDFGEPDLRLDSLAEISLEALIAKVENTPK